LNGVTPITRSPAAGETAMRGNFEKLVAPLRDAGRSGNYAFMAVSAALRLSKDLSGNLESSSLW